MFKAFKEVRILVQLRGNKDSGSSSEEMRILDPDPRIRSTIILDEYTAQIPSRTVVISVYYLYFFLLFVKMKIIFFLSETEKRAIMEKQSYCHVDLSSSKAICNLYQLTCPEVYPSICLLTANRGQIHKGLASLALRAQRYSITSLFCVK